MMERCPECGSFDSQCAFDEPYKDCGCNRCLRAANAALRQQRDELLEVLTSVVNHPNTFNWETIRAALAKIEGSK